jgi:hypothetical protein
MATVRRVDRRIARAEAAEIAATGVANAAGSIAADRKGRRKSNSKS